MVVDTGVGGMGALTEEGGGGEGVEGEGDKGGLQQDSGGETLGCTMPGNRNRARRSERRNQ